MQPVIRNYYSSPNAFLAAYQTIRSERIDTGDDLFEHEPQHDGRPLYATWASLWRNWSLPFLGVFESISQDICQLFKIDHGAAAYRREQRSDRRTQQDIIYSIQGSHGATETFRGMIIPEATSFCFSHPILFVSDKAELSNLLMVPCIPGIGGNTTRPDQRTYAGFPKDRKRLLAILDAEQATLREWVENIRDEMTQWPLPSRVTSFNRSVSLGWEAGPTG